MEITNAKTAKQWLASWGNKPRAGILQAAIDGQYLRAFTKTGSRDERDAIAALKVLTAAKKLLTRNESVATF